MKIFTVTLFLIMGISSFSSCCTSKKHSFRSLANQGYFHVISTDGLQSDIKLVTKYLSMDIDSLFYFFGKSNTEIMKIIPYKIVIQSVPDQEVYEGQAMLSSGTDNGRIETYYAYLRVLAHSKYKHHGKTLTNDPHDEHFFRKIMVHEYSTVIADVVMRNKKGGGWRYHHSPRWFVEGFVEYLAFTHSGNENLERFEKLQKMARANKEILKNPYIFGPIFVKYLIDEFGKEKLLSFMLSSEKTFQTAFRKQYGSNHHQLIESFKFNF